MTVENESPEAMRAYFFNEGRDNLSYSTPPICVVTDGFGRVLYWFPLGELGRHVCAREFSFVRNGDKHVLTFDGIHPFPGPETRTILTYTLTTVGIETTQEQDNVPVTPEWARIKGTDKGNVGVRPKL